MKRHYQTVSFLLLFAIYGCTGRYEQPREVDPKDYNQKIANGKETNSEWVKSPQSIAKQLFPRDAHQTDNSSYSIEEKRLSEIDRKIIVTEEGAFDDEVNGEKAIIDLKLKNERWEITRLYISLKRR